MSISSGSSISDAVKTYVIRVYRYEDKNMQGTLYTPYYNNEFIFHSVMELLLLMEELMEQIGYPVSLNNARVFKRTAKQMRWRVSDRIKPWPDSPLLAAFKIRVMFRQSSTWQGELGWHEGDESISFRSVLELLKLMDSALAEKDTLKAVQA